mgnify:CR=1 FL=1
MFIWKSPYLLYTNCYLFRVDYKALRDDENFMYVPPEQKKKFVNKKKSKKATGKLFYLTQIDLLNFLCRSQEKSIFF